jgi:hypothetical protein
MDGHFFVMNAVEDSCPVSPYGKLRNFTGLGRSGRRCEAQVDPPPPAPVEVEGCHEFVLARRKLHRNPGAYQRSMGMDSWQPLSPIDPIAGL